MSITIALCPTPVDTAFAAVTAGDNIVITDVDGDQEISTNPDSNFTTVTATGNINAGTTISVGGNTYISSSGFDANNQKIIRVANGTVATDAVRIFGQLSATNH